MKQGVSSFSPANKKFINPLNRLRLNRKVVVDIISGLFILLFVYTAISKLSGIKGFISVLSNHPNIGKYANIVAWSIPISELIIAFLLFFPRLRTIGLMMAFTLMLLFTAYITYMIIYLPTLPCSCGGAIEMLTWRQHLIFNIFFTVLGLLGLILNKRNLQQ